MCGGSDVTVTHRKHNIGLAIEVDLVFRDGLLSGLTVRDMLLRQPECWGKSYYVRALSEQYLDAGQVAYSEDLMLDLVSRKSSFHASREEIVKQRIEPRVQEIIQERREQIERLARERAEEAERENQPRCMIL